MKPLKSNLKTHVSLLTFSLLWISACSSVVDSSTENVTNKNETIEDAQNTLSLNSSEISSSDIYANYLINDGFFNTNRNTAFVLTFSHLERYGQTVYFDQGEKIYINGERIPYYENSYQGQYIAWVELQESDTHVEIKIVDSNGDEHLQNITLAIRPTIENYSFGDTAPELSNGIDLSYSPSKAVTANFNVGGGECQTNFDHSSSSNGQIGFEMSSLRDAEEEALWTSGETVYIRLRNQKTDEAPSAFALGSITSNGFRNLELMVP